MGSLARKMQRALARNPKTSMREKPPVATRQGIFCDCHGTLYSHSFTKDDLLVSYLNAQFSAGTDVVLVSSVPRQVLPHIRDIGLNPELLYTLTDKSAYYNSVLEILIDDDPVNRAAKHWHPTNPEFRRIMTDYVLTQKPASRTLAP